MRISRRELAWLSAAGLAADTTSLGAAPVSPAPSIAWEASGRHVIYDSEESCSYCQTLVTRRGDVLLTFLAGDPPRTMLMRSVDRARTWSVPQVIAERGELEGGGGWGLAELASGRLIMAHLEATPWPRPPQWPPASEPRKMGAWPEKNLHPWGWGAGSCKLRLRTHYSDDGGRRWRQSQPISCPPFAAAIPLGCGPLFEALGRLHMPVHVWTGQNPSGACAFLVSDDHGLTWQAGSVVAEAPAGSGVGYREVSIQRLPDGAWIALCRANRPALSGGYDVSSDIAFSRDDGRHWSKPRPAFTALSWPRLTLLPNGVLCAIGASRGGLRRWLSENDGQTWAREDILYTRDYRENLGRFDFGSAAAVPVASDRILVTYYAPRDSNTAFDRLSPTSTHIEGVWMNVPRR